MTSPSRPYSIIILPLKLPCTLNGNMLEPFFGVLTYPTPAELFLLKAAKNSQKSLLQIVFKYPLLTEHAFYNSRKNVMRRKATEIAIELIHR